MENLSSVKKIVLGAANIVEIFEENSKLTEFDEESKSIYYKFHYIMQVVESLPMTVKLHTDHICKNNKLVFLVFAVYALRWTCGNFKEKSGKILVFFFEFSSEISKPQGENHLVFYVCSLIELENQRK